jgi:ubiquinone/menaquinone biosynthesis C-methylase UbiE
MPEKSNTDSKAPSPSPQRRQGVDTHRLISVIPILPHHHVADIGCGSGYYTIPLGKYLFDGKVFALDDQQEHLDATQEARDAVRLTNVELLPWSEAKLPLNDESLDGALIAFSLQEAKSPRALLKEAQRCLKNSGWLAILDWYKRDMDEGPPLNKRMGEEKLRQMTEKLGFRFRGQRDLNNNQYMMLVRK